MYHNISWFLKTSSFIKTIFMILGISYLFGSLANAADAQTIFGPKKYNASMKGASYTENIAVAANETSLSYRIKVKNGSGEVILTPPCTGTRVQILLCTVRNKIAGLRIKFVRPSAVEISFINRPASEIIRLDGSQAVLEKLITLTQANQMIVKVTGVPTSFAEVTIEKILGSIDTTAPVILSNVNSGTITNKNLIRISISDSSAVSTQVFKSGVLVSTHSASQFDLTMTEGTNSFVLRARDAAGNMAPDFGIENVVLDTVPISLWVGVKDKYYFQAFPNQIEFDITTNKSLSYLKINAVESVFNEALGKYVYSNTLSGVGVIQLIITAADAAGNLYSRSIQYEVLVDNQAPQILLSNIPLTITANQYLLPIQISDLSNTKTTIEYDGNISAVINEKSFSYLIEFPTDGEKTIRIVSTDEALNQSIKIISVTRDTSPLKVEFISPQANSIYNESTIEVRIRANRPIVSASINGTPAQVSANQVSVNTNISMLSDGKYFFSAEVKDAEGSMATTAIQFEIKSQTSKSWTYEECPVE